MRADPAATFLTAIAPVAPAPPPPNGPAPRALASLARLDALTRARLLVQAARFGLAEYQRPAALHRLLGRVPPPGDRVLDALLDLEQAQEDARCAGSATWRAGTHVEVLVAVMAEGRLLAALRGGG